MAKQLLPPLPGTEYNMLVSHVPFNKTAIDRVIRNATYITILRHPVATYESIFGYFKFDKYFKIERNNTSDDPFETFLSNSDEYFRNVKDSYFKTLLRNRQMFDVGLELKNYNNESLVDNVIQQASNEFDLVMIAEYFDESLVLLKNLLSWDFEDILYLEKNKRNNNLRFQIDSRKRQRILEINEADYKLYQHFNKTFWNKVEAYGDGFHEDVATFRGMLQKMRTGCVDEGKFVIDNKNRRNSTLLKNNAPTYCPKVNRDDFAFLAVRQQSWILQTNTAPPGNRDTTYSEEK
ncbi:galactosylceramide sulfotransferase-like [Saccoglossus kowalevskii]|uniref:Galactosylceramide sulfotransferase-like n=1 Tax=Saccoglossus kowalevskii TaxID=10224 RepID=A0ABM0N0Q7_SACKO|nr:PREDICTED: galactosylceramide sulfotransferase-like [Saccoglossus kowalevskii]